MTEVEKDQESPPSISVFIPMYNEEVNAGILLPLLQKTLREITEDYEILVIDDSSKDRTVALVEDYMTRDERIRMIQHPRNRGYGATLRTGFLNVKKDLVFYTDADVPIDFSDLKKTVPLLKEHPVVIGYRIDRADTLKRWLFSRIYNQLMRHLFKVRVRDVNFSFKIFRRDVIQKIAPQVKSKSVFIDGEILALVVREGFPIHEVPIEYTPRKHGLSTLGSWNQAWRTFKEVFLFWRGRL